MNTQKLYLPMVAAAALAISGACFASSAEAHDNHRRGHDAGFSVHRHGDHHGDRFGKHSAYHWNKARKWHHRKHRHHGHDDWDSHHRPHRSDRFYEGYGNNSSLSGIFFLSDW